jgi:CheY-like chemotaxis protein
MLAFARRQELHVEPTDLAALVHGMRVLMARSLDPSIVLMVEMPLHLPRVLIDRNQLEIALLNLCINARDAMPEGGKITFTARVDNRDGEFIHLSIKDTGAGMDAATLARATEPFFTTKGIGKGTGLGLSMVHGLVEQWGGGMIIDSAPGKGTTVTLKLPQAAPEPSEDATSDTSAEAIEAPATAPQTILVVDDDPLVLIGTTAMLEDLGHTAVSALSGNEALEILNDRSDIGMIITDHAMPNMTGLQLAERVSENWPRIPVILATGYAEIPDSVATGLPRLAKPFLQDHLATAIVKSLKASKAENAP